MSFVFAHSYKKPELLEGLLVVDLARRLPSYAKQRFLDYLSDRFGNTGDPSFANLLEFVEREENSKSSDFSVQLMADDKLQRVEKPVAKSSVPVVKVKKTSAQVERESRNGVKARDDGPKPPNGQQRPHVAVTRTSLKKLVPSHCFVCELNRVQSS